MNTSVRSDAYERVIRNDYELYHIREYEEALREVRDKSKKPR